jgi:hypothetical protein
MVGALMDRFGASAFPTALGWASAFIFICAAATSVEWRQSKVQDHDLHGAHGGVLSIRTPRSKRYSYSLVTCVKRHRT